MDDMLPEPTRPTTVVSVYGNSPLVAFNPDLLFNGKWKVGSYIRMLYDPLTDMKDLGLFASGASGAKAISSSLHTLSADNKKHLIAPLVAYLGGEVDPAHAFDTDAREWWFLFHKLQLGHFITQDNVGKIGRLGSWLEFLDGCYDRALEVAERGLPACHVSGEDEKVDASLPVRVESPIFSAEEIDTIRKAQAAVKQMDDIWQGIIPMSGLEFAAPTLTGEQIERFSRTSVGEVAHSYAQALADHFRVHPWQAALARRYECGLFEVSRGRPLAEVEEPSGIRKLKTLPGLVLAGMRDRIGSIGSPTLQEEIGGRVAVVDRGSLAGMLRRVEGDNKKKKPRGSHQKRLQQLRSFEEGQDATPITKHTARLEQQRVPPPPDTSEGVRR